MSIFSDHMIDCPGCGTPVACELVQSVNVDRRPDLREEILGGRFQVQTCPSCQTSFRVEPEFVYLDVGRGQYIGVWPASKRGDWQSLSARTQDGFDRALGKQAPKSAREVGEKLEVRAVFGWPALFEKIIARQEQVDDVTLEMAKVVALRSLEEPHLPGPLELRMIEADGGNPVLAWFGPIASGEFKPPGLQIPKQLLSDIEASPEQWSALRGRVREGPVVDFQRDALAG